MTSELGNNRNLGAQVFKAQQRVRWGPRAVRLKKPRSTMGCQNPQWPWVTPHFSGSSLPICERRKYSPLCNQVN